MKDFVGWICMLTFLGIFAFYVVHLVALACVGVQWKRRGMTNKSQRFDTQHNRATVQGNLKKTPAASGNHGGE